MNHLLPILLYSLYFSSPQIFHHLLLPTLSPSFNSSNHLFFNFYLINQFHHLLLRILSSSSHFINYPFRILLCSRLTPSSSTLPLSSPINVSPLRIPSLFFFNSYFMNHLFSILLCPSDEHPLLYLTSISSSPLLFHHLLSTFSST